MVMGNPRMKLRVVNGWMRWVHREKTFLEDTKHMAEKCDAAHPRPIAKSVLDGAIFLYKKLAETKKIVRGVRRKGVMAACVYYGAQRQAQPYTPTEIARAFEIDEKYITIGCAMLNKLLGLDGTSTIMAGNAVSGTTRNRVAEFACRYCTDLGLGREAAIVACMVANNLARLEVSGNFQPASVATAIILLLQEIPRAMTASPRVAEITRAKLSKDFGISVATISKAYRSIKPWILTVADDLASENYLSSIPSREL